MQSCLSRRRWIVSLLTICPIWSTQAALAQNIAYQYHVESTAPRCGQRGTSVDVTMTGFCLDNPQEIIFYRPGIRAVEISSQTDTSFASTLRCRFEIAADCPLGEHPFRVRTATELSNVSTFNVTPFVVIDEDEKTPHGNDTLATAMSVTPDVTIRGRLGAGSRGDIDLYKVPAVAGKRLSVELDSVRITDQRFVAPQGQLDAAVRILDATGRELAAKDDSPLHCQDPVISVRLPTDGFVYIEVRRSSFFQSDQPYCLHVGRHRRPLAAYPAGGPTGRLLGITFLGDPLGTFEETVLVPGETGTFSWFGDAPSPLELRSSSFPNVLEDAAGTVTPVASLPAAINGILETPGDTDSFRIFVKKGDRYLVRAFASSLGLPTDPVIRIRPVTAGVPGTIELQADDSKLADREIFGATPYSGSMVPDTLDPSVVWEPKTDGEYLLEVGDATAAGGETHVYRIEIGPPPELIHIVLESQVSYWQEAGRTTSLAVPRGGRWGVNLFLRPAQGTTFHGDMEILAHGLPAGVRMLPTRVPAGQAIWPVQLVADADAPEAAALVTFEAKSVDPALPLASRCQQNLPFCNLSSGDAWKTLRLDRFVAGVMQPAPFTVEIDPPPSPVLRAGQLGVPVRITRRVGFDEPVEIQFDFVPRGISVQPKTTIPEGQTDAVMTVSAAADAPLGTWPLVVTANTTGGFQPGWYFGTGRVRVSSQIASVSVANPFFTLSAGPESVRRGERKRYVWRVEHRRPLEGKARVSLLGLPNGVRLMEPLPVVTKDSREVAFEIEATDEALLGSVTGIACMVTFEAAGGEIRQRTGSGILRIDPRL